MKITRSNQAATIELDPMLAEKFAKMAGLAAESAFSDSDNDGYAFDAMASAFELLAQALWLGDDIPASIRCVGSQIDAAD